MTALRIPLPMDAHVHLRDGAALVDVVGHTAATFGRALAMPNLKPPVRTAREALAYRARILAGVDPSLGFEVYPALYLTDLTTPAMVREARDAGLIAAKLYPAGATTHSDAGVTDLDRLDPVFDAMAACGLVLCLHGEVTDPEVDIFDRERVFVEQALAPLVARHPTLKVVLEHVTTAEGAAFVAGARSGVAATVTAHHLLIDRNAMFRGGLRPHAYCLPVAKRASHRAALLDAVTRGDGRFFLGTDSAPHARAAKESACGCAGLYTARDAVALYAEAFADRGALDRLAMFASIAGPAFYGLAPETRWLELIEEPVDVPASLPFGDDVVVPFRAGERVRFRAARAAA